jgi:hypothetical protein
VPGKEQDCVRYDELKAAIKTQLSARWGPSGDSDSGPSDADETTTGRLDSLEDGLLASSEAEEEEAHELLARRRRAFYTLLSAELERVSRQYDASLVQLRRKVASLLGEARRGSVLDSLQLGAEDAVAAEAATPGASPSPGGGGGEGVRGGASTRRPGTPGSPPPPLPSQHQQQLDRAFRRVLRRSQLHWIKPLLKTNWCFVSSTIVQLVSRLGASLQSAPHSSKNNVKSANPTRGPRVPRGDPGAPQHQPQLHRPSQDRQEVSQKDVQSHRRGRVVTPLRVSDWSHGPY